MERSLQLLNLVLRRETQQDQDLGDAVAKANAVDKVARRTEQERVDDGPVGRGQVEGQRPDAAPGATRMATDCTASF